LPGSVFYDRAESEDTDSVAKVEIKSPITKPCQGKALTNEALNSIKPSVSMSTSEIIHFLHFNHSTVNHV